MVYTIPGKLRGTGVQEKLAAIANFQSFWSKEIYEGWDQRNR